jgi:enterochelin esterase-like enzyme
MRAAAMLRKWCIAALLCALSLLSFAGLAAAESQVLRLKLFSATLGADWDYVIYLPDGYETSGLRYPAMYLLHGNGGAASDYVEKADLQKTADLLIAERDMPPAIIVTPAAGASWYINRHPLQMENAILEEFIPHVETHFRVLDDRKARVMGGVSMGGYGTLRFVLKRPDLFSAAALMSPAAYADSPNAQSAAMRNDAFTRLLPNGQRAFDREAWARESYPMLIDDFLKRKLPVRFYIDSGDSDEFEIYDHALRLYRFLRLHKQTARFGLAEGAHDWPTWSRNLKEALRYAFEQSPQPMR